MMGQAQSYTGYGELKVHLYRPKQMSDEEQEEEEIRPKLRVKDVYTSGSEAEESGSLVQSSLKAPRRGIKKRMLESSEDEDACSSAGGDKHDAASNAVL